MRGAIGIFAAAVLGLAGSSTAAVQRATANPQSIPPQLIADPYPSTYKAPVSPPVVFVGGTILDGAGKRIDDGEMVLSGGKVRAIGHSLKRPSGAIVIDARGSGSRPG